MTLSERINALLHYTGLNVSKFSRTAGFTTTQAIREMIKGRTKSLSFEAESKIMTAYPEINRSWLKTGEGEMLNPTNQSRNINKIGNDATFTMGDYSHVFKDDTIEIEDCGGEQPDKDIVKIRYTIRSYKKKIEELEKQVAHLEGQVAQQSEFIKLLMQNK